MTDDQKDPTERERLDEDLEMDAEQAEDVKGGDGVSLTGDATTAAITQQTSNLQSAMTTPTKTETTSSGLLSKFKSSTTYPTR